MLTQKQRWNEWMAACAAVLASVVFVLCIPVQGEIPKMVAGPALPGAGVSMEDALAKAEVIAAGTIYRVTFDGADSKGLEHYSVKIKVTRELLGSLGTNGFMVSGGSINLFDGTIDVQVLTPNSESQANTAGGTNQGPASKEVIPKDGREYVFFISAGGNRPSQPIVFKLLPGTMAVPGVVPEFPQKAQTLEDVLAQPSCNVVVGRFARFEPSFELAREKERKLLWWQKYKTVIDVKKTLRGKINPGLIEGDLGYAGSDNLGAANRPRPTPPDAGRDYICFLSYGGHADHVEAGKSFPKDYIFYLSPGRPSETRYEINQACPVDAFSETATPAVAPPSAMTSTANLPLPGSDLTLEAADAKAQTIVVGRLIEMSAFHGNPPEYTQADTIEILKTLRGRVGGTTIQYCVPVKVGREAPLEMGKSYLFFVSHYGVPLKVARDGSEQG